MNNEQNSTEQKQKFPWGLLKFSLLLISVMSLMLWYSCRDNEVKIFGIEIKNNSLFSFFAPESELISFFGIRYQWNSKTEVDTTKQRILVAGDSMSGFLRFRLNDYCEKNGHTMHSVVWNSGNTVWYADTDTLDHFIRKFNPTYVMIVLGANELTLPKPEIRQKHVQEIVDKIGSIPYIWVGPLGWIKDTGINDVILRVVGRKRFFYSADFQYDKLPDGAHPTRKSAYEWMDLIAEFMMTKAKHPILMEKPDQTASSFPPTSMLAPLYSGNNNEDQNLEDFPEEMLQESNQE